MKKFNLEKALAGEPVVTRDGRKVKDLKLFTITNIFKLFGVIDGDLESFTIEGHCSFKEGHEHDLFMAEEKQSIWVNVYKLANGEMCIGCSYSSLKDAMRYTDGYGSYLKTIEITI